MDRRLNSEENTRAFAKSLAAALQPGDSLGLIGPLGTGKTTLTRYLVKELGITQDVSSPSYVLEHEYIGTRKVSHWDLYRLKSYPAELLEAPRKDTIRIVEWPDKFPECLGDFDLVVTLAFDTSCAEARSVAVAGKKAHLIKE